MTSIKITGSVKLNLFIKRAMESKGRKTHLKGFKNCGQNGIKTARDFYDKIHHFFKKSMNKALTSIKYASHMNYKGYILGVKLSKPIARTFNTLLGYLKPSDNIAKGLDKLSIITSKRKLKPLKKDFVMEFPLDRLNKLTRRIRSRNLFTGFISIKSSACIKIVQKQSKRFLCLFVTKSFTKQINTAFGLVLDHYKQEIYKKNKIHSVLKIFYKMFGKVWGLVCFNTRVPKFFLSNQWKLNAFSYNYSFCKRNWKKFAISQIFHVIEKRLLKSICFGYCKLIEGLNKSFYNSTPCSSKLLSISSDFSFTQSTRKGCDITKNTFTIMSFNHKYTKILSKVTEILCKQHRFIIQAYFNKLKLIKTLRKVLSQRTPCKYLPLCRKLKKSMTGLIKIPKESASYSPINRINKQKIK